MTVEIPPCPTGHRRYYAYHLTLGAPIRTLPTPNGPPGAVSALADAVEAGGNDPGEGALGFVRLSPTTRVDRWGVWDVPGRLQGKDGPL